MPDPEVAEPPDSATRIRLQRLFDTPPVAGRVSAGLGWAFPGAIPVVLNLVGRSCYESDRFVELSFGPAHGAARNPSPLRRAQGGLDLRRQPRRGAGHL